MIDEYGYRPNVGIIITNQKGQVLLAKCKGKKAWQFPQGGIEESETPLESAYRELYEEVGLRPEDVQVLGETRSWLRYVLPKEFRRSNSKPTCIGQKQKWFLMRMVCDDASVCLDLQDKPEFDDWDWVDYWSPIKQVIFFKQAVYRSALCELSNNIFKGRDRYLPEKYHKISNTKR